MPKAISSCTLRTRSHYDQTFGKFSILDTKNDIEEGRKWRRNQRPNPTRAFVQKVRPNTPVWFLEGRVSMNSRQKWRNWRTRTAGNSRGPRICADVARKKAGTSVAGPVQEVRLLALDRTKLEKRHSTVMETYRKNSVRM
ncbi:MAG: hypothetical protein R3F31_12215 [Verrucomicrobiales bacterium]